VTYSLLGSYVVQSDLGDYDPDEHRPGIDYIRAIQFAPHQTEELLDKIAELHRTHRSVSPADFAVLTLIVTVVRCSAVWYVFLRASVSLFVM